MNNSTSHQSTSGPPPPKPNGKRPSSNPSGTPSPSGTGPNNSKKAKGTEKDPHLTWEQKYAALREKHVWLLMHSQGKERENKRLTNQVMEGVMELEMTKEWMADQLEELDLWRKGIYIHPDHQVKVPVSHEGTATPVSIGAPELGDAAGSSGSFTRDLPMSVGVQDSIDQNLLKELGIPSNLANDIECSEDFLRSVGAGSCGGGGGSVKTVNTMMPATPVGEGTGGVKNISQDNAHLNGRIASQQDSSPAVAHPLQATPTSGASGLAQKASSFQNNPNLTWGIYIPNLHQQGALIRQDTAQNMSDAIKTPKVATPQTQLPIHPAQTRQLPNATNGNHLIEKYYQGIASIAGTPQAPPSVQTHRLQLSNSNDGNFIGNYHQLIDDASQTPQDPPSAQILGHHTQFPSANNIRPTGTYLRGPVANVRLTFPSNNDDAAAQIRRYQKLLEEDAEKFLKMTEKHE